MVKKRMRVYLSRDKKIRTSRAASFSVDAMFNILITPFTLPYTK